MAKSRRAELVTKRKLAIASGAVLAAGVTAGLMVASRRRQEQLAATPTLGLEWGEHMGHPEEIMPTTAMAEFNGFGDKKFNKHLAVLATNGVAFDEQLREGGRPAVAVLLENGYWRTGVASEADAFGELSHSDRRIVAIGVGAPALQGAIMGVMHGEDFRPLDTDTIHTGPAHDVMREFGEVPILSRPTPVL